MPGKKNYDIFNLMSISKSIFFCIISKNSTNNLRLKIEPSGLDFLNLLAFAENFVLLLEPLGPILCVYGIYQNAVLLSVDQN